MSTKKASAKQESTRRDGVVVTLLYGLSGAAAMGHEVLWTRMARSLLGGDARALAVALVATLVGLVTGALFAPRLLRRWGALSAFIRVEALAAAVGVLLPWLMKAVHPFIGLLYRAFGAGTAFSMASFVVAVLLLLPATFALGAGLPLLSAAFPANPRMAGVLYGSHAGGSALGASFVGFALLPAWGAPLTALVASSLTALVCLLATRLRKVTTLDQEHEAGTTSSRLMLLPFAIAGMCSFALQSLWTRIAALAMGPTVQSFALVATLYVVALFFGALLASALARVVRNAWLAAAVCLFLAAILGVFSLSSVGAWPTSATAVFATLHDGRVSYDALMKIFSPTIVPTVALFGAAFSFASFAIEDETKGRGARGIGELLAAAACGNALGALIAPFVLVPSVGLLMSIKLSASCAALAAILLLLLRAHSQLKARTIIGFLGVTLTVIAFMRSPSQFDVAALTSGPFLYAGPSHPDLGEIIFAHDGVDATVTVRRAGDERMLQIDGKIDGSTIGDAPTQTLVGLLPTLLAPRTERALVIGLGTGMTVDAVRVVPGVESVDVAELVSGVRYAAPAFASATHRVLDDRRVRVIETDGSLLVRHSDARWDVIVSEPSNPWVAGMGDLFSEETFRAARAHLRPGGVMATWFHVYATDLSIVRSIMATFAEAFPNATLWELTRGEDYLLLGTNDPEGQHGIDADRIAARFANVDVQERLTRAGVPNLPALLGRLVATSEGILRASTDVDRLSMIDANLEARAARALYHDASRDALSLFDEIAVHETDLRVQARSADGRALALAWPAALEARALARRAVLRALARDEDGAIFLGERAMGLLPEDTSIQSLVATLYLSRGKTHALANEIGDARDALLTVLEIDPPDVDTRVDALVTLGDLDLATGRVQQGLDRYLRARRMRPNSPDIVTRVSAALQRLGANEDAARAQALSDALRGLDGPRAAD